MLWLSSSIFLTIALVSITLLTIASCAKERKKPPPKKSAQSKKVVSTKKKTAGEGSSVKKATQSRKPIAASSKKSLGMESTQRPTSSVKNLTSRAVAPTPRPQPTLPPKFPDPLQDLRVEPPILRATAGEQILRIHNHSGKRHAFTSMLTDPKLYSLHPAQGFVEPGEAREIKVEGGDVAAPKSDKLVLLTIPAEASARDARVEIARRRTFTQMMVVPILTHDRKVPAHIAPQRPVSKPVSIQKKVAAATI